MAEFLSKLSEGTLTLILWELHKDVCSLDLPDDISAYIWSVINIIYNVLEAK